MSPISGDAITRVVSAAPVGPGHPGVHSLFPGGRIVHGRREYAQGQPGMDAGFRRDLSEGLAVVRNTLARRNPDEVRFPG